VRAVIDTNVLMAGLLWRGPPHALLQHVRAGTVSLVSSPALLAELADVIGRAKFDAILTRTNTSRERSLAEVRRLAEVIEPPPLQQPVCRDPDDDEVLALAIAAKVELIVSGDNDLLSLRSFQGIPILAPAEAVSLIGATGNPSSTDFRVSD
jgi:putative PIN family toxin of toxin-antitoxin system